MNYRGVTRDSWHDFTRGKSCLTNLVAFHAEVTVALGDKRRETAAMYTDFYKAFDMVFHNTLVAKLERQDFDRWTVRLIRNWLDSYIQRVAVNSSMVMSNK